MVSIANTRFQDVSKLLPHAMRVWWYLSPGLYTLDQIPDSILPFELLNPFAVIFPAYQSILMYAELPDFSIWWRSIIVTVLILVAGLIIFIRAERNIAKYV
jgi:ABC-type polysaccharide/polyol phosphate export permease